VASYRHPIAVGVRTTQGWTLARGADTLDRQVVRITTPDRPLEVRLDPYHFSWDLGSPQRRGGECEVPQVEPRALGVRLAVPRTGRPRARDVALLSPAVWYSDFGRGTYGLRTRLSYVGWLDRSSLGIAVPQRQVSLDPDETVQVLVADGEPVHRPTPGHRLARRARSPGRDRTGQSGLGASNDRHAQKCLVRRVAHGAIPKDGALLPELWSSHSSVDLTLAARWTLGATRGNHWFIDPRVLFGVADEGYSKAELVAGRIFFPMEWFRVGVRAFGATEWQTPPQRALVRERFGSTRNVRQQLVAARGCDPQASRRRLAPTRRRRAARLRLDRRERRLSVRRQCGRVGAVGAVQPHLRRADRRAACLRRRRHGQGVSTPWATQVWA